MDFYFPGMTAGENRKVDLKEELMAFRARQLGSWAGIRTMGKNVYCDRETQYTLFERSII
jgi:hypothetical protein